MDGSLSFVISKAALRIKSELGRRIKAYDVTPEQWVLLHRLWEKDGLSQKELAAQIVKDQPNTTRILDKLGQKGLIRRANNADDRRAFVISLTDAGRELVSILFPLVQEVRENACRGVSDEEIALLKSLLNKISKNLE
jgi:DNA-binding MarR family transcriptional regulator